MPKSLALSSKGLAFDEFMKAIVKIEVKKPERKPGVVKKGTTQKEPSR